MLSLLIYVSMKLQRVQIMDFIHTTYQNNPELVTQYLAFLGKVNTSEKDGGGFTSPMPKDVDHYVLAVDAGKVVGGIKIEITTKDAPHVLAFQRKEVFDTLKRNAGFLDFNTLKLADISHATVLPEQRRSGLGLKLFQEAFALSSSLGSDITFMWPNQDNAGPFFSKVRKQSPFPTFDIATVDLITDNFDRIRNTKKIIAVAHTPEVQQSLRMYQNGHIPLNFLKNNTTVYASPHGKAAGIQAVLFDWDNVLVDDVSPWVSAISKTLRELKREGYEIPSNVRSTHSQHPKDYLITVLGKDLAEKAYPILLKNYEELMPQTISLKPEALQTLRMLKRKQVPFAIVSNSQEHNLNKQVAHLLHPEFQDIPVLGNAKKPSPDALYAAMKTLNVSDPSKVFFIGDSGENDVKAGLICGVKPILFSAGDITIVNKLSEEGHTAEVGFVRDHKELQKFLTAQIRANTKAITR